MGMFWNIFQKRILKMNVEYSTLWNAFFLRWGLIAQAGLKFMGSSDSPSSASQVTRTTGVYHHTGICFVIYLNFNWPSVPPPFFYIIDPLSPSHFLIIKSSAGLNILLLKYLYEYLVIVVEIARSKIIRSNNTGLL